MHGGVHLWRLALMAMVAAIGPGVQVRDRRRPGWCWIDNCVVDRIPEIGVNSAAVYLILARWARNETQAYQAPVPALAAQTGLSQSTVKRALKKLVETKLIGVQRQDVDGLNRANIYVLLDPYSIEEEVASLDTLPSGHIEPTSVHPRAIRRFTHDQGSFKLRLNEETTGASPDETPKGHPDDDDAGDRELAHWERKRAAALDRAAKDPARPGHMTPAQWLLWLEKEGRAD